MSEYQLPSYISGTTEGIEFSPVQITPENATIPNKLPTGLTNNGSQEKDAAVGQSVPASSVDQNQFLTESVVLEEHPDEYNCFENETNLDKADEFSAWLRKIMFEGQIDPQDSDSFTSRESQGAYGSG
ncbi:Two-component response regulator ORR24 [Quillaja saponaria]|uniref:Two-component response regulator ORR24 n=1 Tax=Quillaja saponaria TaxID=32244 RepID=A0AAD7KN25_QUISA|nr:Two-component response regulator ORR24 [Quillaja saponaria]